MLNLKTIFCCLTLSLLSNSWTMAAEEFPYQAVVQTKQVEVRSGPGQAYYATSYLKNGDKVIVHRHDPGGWFQISPPPGSFSWIRAEQVTRQGNTGIVINNDTKVRVGSNLEQRFDVEQRRLLAGDEVQIIEEKTVTQKGKTVTLFKISPPELEYRWVKGDYLVAVNKSLQAAKDSDPYAVPSEYLTVSNTKTEYFDKPAAATTEMPALEVLPGLPGDARTSGDEPAGSKMTKANEPKSVVTKAKNPELEIIEAKFSPQMETQEKKLAQLDAAFSAMVKQDPATWNLEGLSKEYKDLQGQALTPIIGHQVDLRLAAVERYGKTKAQHDEMQRILNKTTMKDAQFTQEAMSIPVEGAELSTAPVVVPAPSPQIMPAAGSTAPTFPMIPQSQIVNPQPMPQQGFVQPVSGTMMTPAPQPPRPLAFSGAGVVQRSAYWGRQGPSHVLVSTQQGRILAYLQASPGVNLDGFLGRSVGVSGPRMRVPNLQADVITVEQVAPVKLAQ
jgi:uncharacterized protein YgiM (DUF1202 family)